ncbi:MAG TPA: 50S ribosomal protein L11, partial [Sulfurovum sp.]|nr:50S ribosomal protein L11 [Sulfurovum sp.]
ETKQPPASDLILKEAGIKKGTDNPILNKVATLSQEQLYKIVDLKIEDLNTIDRDVAAKIIAGSCRSMGIEIAE